MEITYSAMTPILFVSNSSGQMPWKEWNKLKSMTYSPELTGIKADVSSTLMHPENKGAVKILVKLELYDQK